MSYEDPTTWELCGVSYEATRKQANAIMVDVMATKEWETYAVAKERCNTGDYDACSDTGKALAQSLVSAYRTAFIKTLGIVRQHLGDEAA